MFIKNKPFALSWCSNSINQQGLTCQTLSPLITHIINVNLCVIYFQLTVTEGSVTFIKLGFHTFFWTCLVNHFIRFKSELSVNQNYSHILVQLTHECTQFFSNKEKYVNVWCSSLCGGYLQQNICACKNTQNAFLICLHSSSQPNRFRSVCCSTCHVI